MARRDARRRRGRAQRQLRPLLGQLYCHASYPAGIKVTDDETATINLTAHDFHGEWNYTITAKPT